MLCRILPSLKLLNECIIGGPSLASAASNRGLPLKTGILSASVWRTLLNTPDIKTTLFDVELVA